MPLLLVGGLVAFLVVVAAGIGGYWWYTHRQKAVEETPVQTSQPEPAPAEPEESGPPAETSEVPAGQPETPAETPVETPSEQPAAPPRSEPAPRPQSSSPKSAPAPAAPASEPLPLEPAIETPAPRPMAPPPPVSPADALGKPCGSNREFVESLYRSVHDRQPDEVGTAYWVTALENGGRREEAYRAFFGSKEYLERRKSDREFIRDLYQACLSREPDAAGMEGWLGVLVKEKKPKKIQAKRDELLNSVLGLPEYLSIRAGC